MNRIGRMIGIGVVGALCVASLGFAAEQEQAPSVLADGTKVHQAETAPPTQKSVAPSGGAPTSDRPSNGLNTDEDRSDLILSQG